MEADPTQVKAFIDQWDLYNEDRNHYTEEQREQIRREHPLKVDFYGKVTCNGRPLRRKHSCGLTWLSTSCLPTDRHPESEAKWVLEHYGLNLDKAWSIHRCAYGWGAQKEESLESLDLRMVRNPENFAGQHFLTPAVGESVSLTHPLNGQVYTLTVHEVEQQELPDHAFRDANTEYPMHFTAMSYSLEPDITGQGFMIQDCANGDKPRRKNHDASSVAVAHAAAIGVIGGADGPMAIVMGQNTPKLHAACSSLHFDPVDEVEWRTVFSEKLMEDMDVCLM